MAAAQTMAMTTTQKIIAIAVTIIIISTVAIPVIDDLQSTIHSTGQNTTQKFAVSNQAVDSVSIQLSGSVVTVNGFSLTPSEQVIIAISDDFRIVALDIGGTVQVHVGTDSDTNRTTGDITITNGNLTYTVYGSDTPTVKALTSPNILYASESGSYGQFSGGLLNVNKDTVMYAVVSHTVSNAGLDPTSLYVSAVVKGTYQGLASAFAYGANSASVSIPEANITEKPGYLSIDTSKGVNISASAVQGVYSTYDFVQFVAPLQYTYYSDADSGLINLIGVIPILLILVPLMMAVRMIALRRN